jgi:hypothetical protein
MSMGPNDYQRGWNDAMSEANQAFVKAGAHREYVPAYRADNGNVIAIGRLTRDSRVAEQEAESLRRPEDTNPIFVAYRDLPEWQPVLEENRAALNTPGERDG